MRLHRSYAPSTYEERGTAIPFTTPALSGARVRKGYRQGLEVLVPSISEARGTYVIPWTALNEVITLTVHDRMLQTEVLNDSALSPDRVRFAGLKVAMTGIAGAAAATAAEQALAAEEEQKTATHFHLILKIISLSGLGPSEILKQLESRERKQFVKKSLADVAKLVGGTSVTLDEQIEELSTIAAPLGVPHTAQAARLRRLLGRLAVFRESCLRWADQDVPDHVPVAQLCAEVADHTSRIGTQTIDDYDVRMADVEQLLRFWPQKSAEIRSLVERMSWLLDGWEFVVSWWDTAQRQSLADQIAALHGIFRILPLVPKEEWADRQGIDVQTVLYAGAKWVRALENWKTGEIDYELVARLEQVRAQASCWM